MKSGLARIDLLTGVGLVALLGLSARLYALSVVQHDEQRTKAQERCRQARVLPPRRGEIVDRLGRPLAVDRPVHHVALDLPALDPALNFVTPLAACLRITRIEALRIVRASRRRALTQTEETFDLAMAPLADVERVTRNLRRRRNLWARVEAGGVVIVTRTEVLLSRDVTLARLAELVGGSSVEIAQKVEDTVDSIHDLEERDDRLHRWQKPLPLVKQAAPTLILSLTERAFELPGVEILKVFERRYPRRDLAVHAIGYLGAPSADEVRRDRNAGRLLDAGSTAFGVLHGERVALGEGIRLSKDPYGRIGVEKTYDETLRGVPGVRVVVRDVRNRVHQELTHIVPRDGETLTLTIDADVQRSLEESLDKALKRHGDHSAGGAGVLIDLKTGDLLALGTAPRFDANTLGDDYRGLVKDPRKPLVHRAVQSYPPASTFKVLMAFAMFDPEREDSLEPGWTTYCDGILERGKRSFKCDGVHHQTDLSKAICYSCNVFFFRAADKVGLAPISDWAQRIGVGGPVARGIFGERGGLVPYPGYKQDRADAAARATTSWAVRLANAMHDPDALDTLDLTRRRALRAAWWAERTMSDRILWPGNVRNSMIGQGDVLLTPIQVAQIAALVATGGRPPRPRLTSSEPLAFDEVELDPTILAEVREGMEQVVSRGTASKHKIGLRGHDVAGKTGTAERRKGEPYLAWFMGYYPASAPEVAFAVLIDRTRGHGGGVCGPIARDLLLAYEKTRGGEGLR